MALAILSVAANLHSQLVEESAAPGQVAEEDGLLSREITGSWRHHEWVRRGAC